MSRKEGIISVKEGGIISVKEGGIIIVKEGGHNQCQGRGA